MARRGIKAPGPRVQNRCTFPIPLCAMPHSPSTTAPPDLDALFQAQQAHAPVMRATTAAERRDRLTRLQDALQAHRSAIQDALHADLRKAPVEVDLTELKTTLDEIQHALDHLDTWMAPDRVDTPLLYTGTRSEVRYEPKGVVLIMAPWNYPLNLTLGPLVGALSAGNCAILKPSEHAPKTAALLADLIGRLYDEREVAVVQGGPDVAQALTAKPFDHIYFTGSPTIGRKVMAAAAEHLTSVTLELGGKSPAVVDASANLSHAAGRIAWSKFTNAGQTCIAPDYVLVDASVHDSLVDHLIDHIHQFYGPTPTAQRASDDYARLIHDDHFEAIVGLLSDAIERGATLATGGQHDADERYVAPTVLTDVPLDADLMQQEIFGPLLPVLPYTSLEEALHIINERPTPLSLYLFSEEEATVETVLQRTTAGSTCVNEGFLHFNNPGLPFGGKDESGIGRGHGRYAFEAFSNERAVLRRTYGAKLIRAFYPPFDRLTSRLTDWLLRLF